MAKCSHEGCSSEAFGGHPRCAEHEIAYWKGCYEAIAAPKPKTAKPKKSFKDRYKTYEGSPGDPDQWRKQAEDLAARLTGTVTHLAALGLSALPETLAELRKARNKASLSAHPDRGGSDAMQAEINAAYEALAVKLEVKVEVETATSPAAASGISPVTRPMRAFTLEPEHLHFIKFPVYASFKYDGIRASKFGGKSRTKSFKPVPNKFIREWIEQHLPEGMETEIIIPGKEFNEISSAVMSRDGEPDFVLYAFDYCPANINTPFKKRLDEGREAVAKVNSPRLRFVDQRLIHTMSELLEFEQECLEQGAEGLILHAPEGEYKCGECSIHDQWTMKFKRYVDSEGTVIGYMELMRNTNETKTGEDGKKRRGHSKSGKVPAGTLGTLLLRDESKGWEVEVGGGKNFSAKLRQKLWDNRDKLVAEGAKIKYRYQPRGLKDVARFPGWKGMDDWSIIGVRDPVDMEPESAESFGEVD